MNPLGCLYRLGDQTTNPWKKQSLADGSVKGGPKRVWEREGEGRNETAADGGPTVEGRREKKNHLVGGKGSLFRSSGQKPTKGTTHKPTDKKAEKTMGVSSEWEG